MVMGRRGVGAAVAATGVDRPEREPAGRAVALHETATTIRRKVSFQGRASHRSNELGNGLSYS